MGNIIGILHLAWILIRDPAAALSNAWQNLQMDVVGFALLFAVAGLFVLIGTAFEKLRALFRKV